MNSENAWNVISGNGLWSGVAKATGRNPARIYITDSDEFVSMTRRIHIIKPILQVPMAIIIDQRYDRSSTRCQICSEFEL
jgi:hypothetical protein